MARHLFGSELFLAALGLDAQIAPNAPFTLWSERVGGVQYTDVTAPDGVTALLKNVANTAFLADASGQMPAFRGPDEVYLIWVDAGSGVRFAAIAVEAVRDRLAVADLTVETVQDTVAAMFGAQATYNDTAGTLTLSIPPSSGVDVETVQDTVAAMFGAQATYNDTAGTLTLEAVGGSGATPTFRGNVATEAAMIALPAVKGDWCIRTDLARRYDLTGTTPSPASNWTATPVGPGGSPTFENMPAGSVFDIWYEVAITGVKAVNAWPTVRPSARSDIRFRYCGSSLADPGPTGIMRTTAPRDSRGWVGATA